MFICLHTFTGVVCRFYRGHESRQMLSISFWWKMLNLITNWITNPMDHCILLFYYCSLYFAVMHYNENENRKRATQYAGQLSSRLRSFFITNIDDDKSRVWKTCLMTNYKSVGQLTNQRRLGSSDWWSRQTTYTFQDPRNHDYVHLLSIITQNRNWKILIKRWPEELEGFYQCDALWWQY